MVRRLKKDVLTELPPKTRQAIQVASDVEDDFGDLGDDYETASTKLKTIPFEKISETRHAQALAKVDACLEQIGVALESEQKVIVFAHHHDVIERLREGLKDYGVVTVYGEDSASARDAACKAFQTDPNTRVFIGSLKAAGVGLTLTAARLVIFVEFSWVPADMTQAEDRAHRITQKEPVTVWHLVNPGSLDERMMRFVREKQEIADLALDTPTMQDVSGREVVAPSSADPTVNPALAPTISYEEISAIHADLKRLASVCDGAIAEDGQGFNGLDANFGRTLAAQKSLSPRQAVAARKMLAKYRKQLGRAA